LIGDHADRQQYADCAGNAELVADAIELAHFILPRFLGEPGMRHGESIPHSQRRRLARDTAEQG